MGHTELEVKSNEWEKTFCPGETDIQWGMEENNHGNVNLAFVISKLPEWLCSFFCKVSLDKEKKRKCKMKEEWNAPVQLEDPFIEKSDKSKGFYITIAIPSAARRAV